MNYKNRYWGNLQYHRTQDWWGILGLILTIAVYLFLRGWHFNFPPLFAHVDEAFSLVTVRLGWADMVQQIAADLVHPPLFYLLLKIWISFVGEHVYSLRLFTNLFAFGSLPCIIGLGRLLGWSMRQCLLPLILLTFNSFLIVYGQQLRMYTLFQFLSLLSLYAVVQWIHNPTVLRWKILVFFFNFLLILTHYFGWVVVGCEFITLVVTARSLALPFTGMMCLASVLEVPWIVYSMSFLERGNQLVDHIGWIPMAGVQELAVFFATMNGIILWPGADATGVLLRIGIIVFSLLYGRRTFKGNNPFGFEVALLLPLAIVAPLSIFLLAQLIGQSFWVTRYLIFVFVPYYFLLTTCIESWKLRYIPAITSFFLVASSLMSFVDFHYRNRTPPSFVRIETMSRTFWEQTKGNPPPVYCLSLDQRKAFRDYLSLVSKKPFSFFTLKHVDSISQIEQNQFWLLIGFKKGTILESQLSDGMKTYLIQDKIFSEGNSFDLYLLNLRILGPDS